MTYVRATLLSLTLLVIWGVLATVLAPLHRVGFALVPPDGTVSEAVRRREDLAITRYFLSGDTQRLISFTSLERQHLGDVRSLLGWFLLLGGVGGLVLLMVKPRRSDVEPSLIGLLGLGLGTLVVFPVTFERFHQVFFAGGAPWYFPPDQFLLTQLYPFQFFAVMWLLVVLLAAFTILTLRRFLSCSDVAKVAM